MKNLIIVPIIFLFLISAIIVQAQDRYFIVFCGNDGMPGHAFVMFGRESESEKMSIIDGAWGLYPSNSRQGGKSFIIGEVPGEIRDEGITKKCNYKVVSEVSKSEYENGLEVKSQWTSRGRYELTKSDCVSFLIAVARCVDSLRVPDRNGLDNFPARYLKSLSEHN